MSDTVQDGAVVSMDPRDERVFRFDWDTDNLPAGAAIASQSLQVIGLQPTPAAITSITRAGTTATVATATVHGLATGEIVTIAGADQADYNVTATITVTSTTLFTYTVANSPTTPATGTMTYSRGLTFDNSSILSSAAYDSRSTQVRLLAKGPDFLGSRYEIANYITTDETPAQTKERSFFVVIENR